jgi:hypothetical protein
MSGAILFPAARGGYVGHREVRYSNSDTYERSVKRTDEQLCAAFDAYDAAVSVLAIADRGPAATRGVEFAQEPSARG